jgi:hypothetical protein
LKVVGNNTLYCCNWQIKADAAARKAKKDKTMGQGVVLPPEDMQIRPTFPMEIVGLEPSFPTIPGLSM